MKTNYKTIKFKQEIYVVNSKNCKMKLDANSYISNSLELITKLLVLNEQILFLPSKGHQYNSNLA